MENRKFLKWLSNRVPLVNEKTTQTIKTILLEPIPHHMKRWQLALGVTPLILFIIQVFTGLLLLFYYVPSPEGAYESVRYITEEVRLGFWIRGIHRWCSSLMVIAIMLHMVRVFFMGGYKAPREINWIVGSLLLIFTLGFCFTGYSLIYNQLSYWASTIGANMVSEIPLIGTPLLYFILGDIEVTANTLTRFFNLHVFILPFLMIVLILLHIVLVRLHGVIKTMPDEPTYPFYPDHFYKGAIIGLFILIAVSALTVINPPGIGLEANPDVTPFNIKPEWYFFAVFSILKWFPLTLGANLMFVFLLVFIFWPFIDKALEEQIPMTKVRYILGSFIIIIFLILTIYETIYY